MNQGDTYRRFSGAHLWIVISDPAADSDRVVSVNLTTKRILRNEDHTCVLDVGDHPFVRHPTYVNYRGARITSNAELDDEFRSNVIKLDGGASTELLAKLISAAHKSPFTAREVKSILAAQGLI